MNWDTRYTETENAYGTEPNDFLRSVLPQLPQGTVLCLAEGQGRNAVFLAEQGREVVAVDQSAVGLAGAQRLARQRGVPLTTIQDDLERFIIVPHAWDTIVSIWVHLPENLRKRVHRAAVEGLRPGGVFVLEAYSPHQWGRTTGGPREMELLMPLDAVKRELDGLTFLMARETDRPIHEGSYHNGPGAVVQILAQKPFK